MAGMSLHAPSCRITALVLHKSIILVHRDFPKVSQGNFNIQQGLVGSAPLPRVLSLSLVAKKPCLARGASWISQQR